MGADSLNRPMMIIKSTASYRRSRFAWPCLLNSARAGCADHAVNFEGGLRCHAAHACNPFPPQCDRSSCLREPRIDGLRRANGKLACKEPFHLKDAPHGFAAGYPAYEPITVNGMTQMIEHRGTEPVFYITDDPVAWKQYAMTGCG